MKSTQKKLSGGMLYLIILAIIVAVHLIGLSLLKSGNRSSGEPQTKPEQITEEPKPTQKQTKENKDPGQGFWSKLFGGDEKTPDKPQEPPQKEIPAPVPAKRYWKQPEGMPNYGGPLNFSGSIKGNLPALPESSGAKTAILVDMNTRRVIWEKDCRRPVALASMAKMMTLLLTFEYLERNPNISLESYFKVPKEVLNVKPRSGLIWLDPKETFRLEEIIKTAAIKSANDSAEMLAVVVSGDPKIFVKKMNDRSAELGMVNTKFVNAHGLGNAKTGFSSGSALDMVILGEQLLAYPKLMEYFGSQQDSIRDGKTVFVNTNGLIRTRYPGVEGLKTGYTNEAGFCLTFSAKRNNRRIMGCVTGFKSAVDRDKFCRKLIDWSFGDKKQ